MSLNKNNIVDDKKKSKAGQSSKNPFRWIIYILVLLVFFLPNLFKTQTGGKEVSWNEFETRMLRQNAIEKLVVVNSEKVLVFIKKDKLNDPYFNTELKQRFSKTVAQGPHYWFSIGSVETFENKLEAVQKNIPDQNSVDVRYEKSSGGFFGVIGWLLPILLLFIFWNVIFKRTSMMGGGGSSIFNFGKSPATMIQNEKSKTTFEDVAGLEEAEIEVKEIVDFLKTPEHYTKIGAKIPKGVILVGPPGTGKTLLAKAVAGEANVPFFSISGSAFVEMFVGVGASRVRDLFKNAKEMAPCIVFIDEIDAIGRSRGKGAMMNASNDERESTLNQLLTEMDGFETNSGVIVLAATNRADMLDTALLRPGRFDRHIYLELPNLNEREAIFKVHMRHLVMEDGIDVHTLHQPQVDLIHHCPYHHLQLHHQSGTDHYHLHLTLSQSIEDFKNCGKPK